MKAERDEVQEMVAALMTVMGSLERAKRQGEANLLSVLQVVAMRGPVRPSDIASDLGVHQSTVTRQMQALEVSGQVAVTVDPEDRRSCFVVLTEAGQAEVARLTEIGLSRFALFVEDWEAEEVRTLGKLLRKLEASKAEANTLPTRLAGRRWQKSQ